MKSEFDVNAEWVKYIKSHPEWRALHNKFINAQVINANNKLKAVSKEKLIELFNIKNKKLLRDK